MSRQNTDADFTKKGSTGRILVVMAREPDEFQRRQVAEAEAEIVRLFLDSYAKWLDAVGQRGTNGAELVSRLTELVRQDLAELKERSNLLYREERTRKPEVKPVEVVFDYLVGAIYHHILKLREVAFQLHSRTPPVDERTGGPEKALLATWRRLVERTRAEFDDGVQVAEEFWRESFEILERLISLCRENPHVIRALIEREAILGRAYRDGGLLGVLRRVYDGRPERGFALVAGELARSGWLEEARSAAELGIRLVPASPELEALLSELRSRQP